MINQTDQDRFRKKTFSAMVHDEKYSESGTQLDSNLVTINRKPEPIKNHNKFNSSISNIEINEEMI